MINEDQLEKWAKPPDAYKYKHTHEEVRKALEKYLGYFSDKNHSYSIGNTSYEVYLQGSYANSTNIDDESDVDVVIQLNKTFSYDLTNLSPHEESLFHEKYSSTSPYLFRHFKQDVFESLQAYFSEDVIEYADKSLKVPQNSLRVNADVIPCFEHKKFEQFSQFSQDEEFVPGIKFYNTGDNTEIINFPRRHLSNCAAKNKDTGENFKDIIRVFKNIKVELEKSGKIAEGSAPSYYIESLIYNATAHNFDGKYSDIFYKLIQFWANDSEKGRLKYYQCASEQDLLFLGDNWAESEALGFILEAFKFIRNE